MFWLFGLIEKLHGQQQATITRPPPPPPPPNPYYFASPRQENDAWRTSTTNDHSYMVEWKEKERERKRERERKEWWTNERFRFITMTDMRLRRPFSLPSDRLFPSFFLSFFLDPIHDAISKTLFVRSFVHFDACEQKRFTIVDT
jgi:hypothetical protein